MKSKSNKLQAKDLINVGIFTAIYFVIFFAGMMLGYIPIALFIGLAMKSSKATIISSFLLIILTQANIGDLTMANNAIFPLILTIISLIFAFLSVVGVEKKDLM